jgi:transcriptional regulator with XRE-family HTH domain
MKPPRTGSRLSQYLRSRRIELALTQREIAESLGYKPQFVTNWERGTSSPPAHILPRLIEVLEVPAAVILKILAEDSAAFWEEVFLPARARKPKKRA